MLNLIGGGFMYCKKCGAEIKPGSIFCSSCGESIENKTGIGFISAGLKDNTDKLPDKNDTDILDSTKAKKLRKIRKLKKKQKINQYSEAIKNTDDATKKTGKLSGLSKSGTAPRVIATVTVVAAVTATTVVVSNKDIRNKIFNKNTPAITEESTNADTLPTSQNEQNAINPNFANVNWEREAVKAIYNYYEINPDMFFNDGFHFYLIDINNDNIPEIFQGGYGGTGGFSISDFLYWDGNSFVLGKIDTSNYPTIFSGDRCLHNFKPYKNNLTSEIVFWQRVLLPEFENTNWAKADYFYGSCDRIVLNNGVISITDSLDRTKYTNILCNSALHSEDEVERAISALKKELADFDSRYTFCSDFKYTSASFGSAELINNGANIESYHKTVSEETAKQIVSDYCNNSASSHFDNFETFE